MNIAIAFKSSLACHVALIRLKEAVYQAALPVLGLEHTATSLQTLPCSFPSTTKKGVCITIRASDLSCGKYEQPAQEILKRITRSSADFKSLELTVIVECQEGRFEAVSA